ncbi:glucose-methanol-choline oxidoreductase [Pseudovirgaria hyperparasitica]|uniref:Glucose-methanol-choline oxidoreductase n=1 Tax=Pseudovirgaria hyperparasitica TaxID=470096 RepID=A0A6A6VUT6_9PEZI|nr:glucose-methanol-choline oxidoreductase [Pseudovirgaria hyperparasitica]KAF2753021.1 glucose-methanol-choline oxidoreductase [Pseudovirgaria hyperparasitica]
MLGTATAFALFGLLSTVSAFPTPAYGKAPFKTRQTGGLGPLDLLGSAYGVPAPNQTFDYIVVGGGNAGLTIAARLAEVPTNRVAVIEAGTFYELSNGNNSETPATDITYVGKALDDWHPGIDWGFATTPQAGLDGDVSHYARGKVLGGSSARNYMTYHAPTTESLQMWADMVDDQSYTFENFYPYYKKSQGFTEPDMSRRFPNATVDYDPDSFGTDGPLSVIYPNYATAFATWAKRAFAEVGMPDIPGFTSGQLIGNAYGPATIQYETNVRDSSETAFLRPYLDQDYPNLIVFNHHLATRIIFDGTRATGVEVDTNGFVYTIAATSEVIVSAGAFQSPQLLMVSGIGPAEVLSANNIPVIADRPGVGQNMWDHVLFGPSYRVNVLTGSAMADPVYTAEQVRLFNEERRGALASPNNDVFAWEKLPHRNWSSSVESALRSFPADWPEIEYIAPQGYFGYCENFNRDAPVDGFNYASVVAGLVAPLSRGNISISSADMRDAPLINPNWLTHEADIAVAIASYRRTRDIWNAPSLRNITIGPEYFPGEFEPSRTDAELLALIKKSVSTIFHASCTCAMGREDDENAVVDTRARVIGAQGLRVVDASSFPILPPGHPMSTVYALAEKIADDIKNGSS